MSADVDQPWVNALDATLLGSRVAQRFLELDALSSHAMPLVSAETLNRFGADRVAALGVAADPARFGVSSVAMLGSGIARQLTEVNALSGGAAALASAETFNRFGADPVAAMGAASDAARFGVSSAAMLGSGVARQLAEVNALSGRTAALASAAMITRSGAESFAALCGR